MAAYNKISKTVRVQKSAH